MLLNTAFGFVGRLGLAVVLLVGCGPGPGLDSDQETEQWTGGDGSEASGPTGLGAGAALSNDLVLSGEGNGDLLHAPGDPGTGGAPKVFYLRYADGRALPRTSPDPCRATAPKFVCNFAPTLVECQRQVQAYLDKWYADFNVVFTLTRPTSGIFYTEVVSSGGGAWCDAATNVAGIAPFLCDDLAGGVAYTFRGGESAKDTAIIIAQEQAHLVGLEHTLSTRDIMDPTICPNCDGFEDVDNRIQNDHCGRAQQNSYEMMKARLGVWTGGIKPTPFGCQNDTITPLVQILAPANNAVVADSFQLRVQASDDCKISRVSVAVAPMGLHTQSTAPPFEWTLTRISGRQTITVTAVDPAGKQSTASVIVNAPGGLPAGGGGDGGTSVMPPGQAGDGAGCDVGGCDVGGHRQGGRGRWAFVVMALALLGLTRLRPPSRAGVTTRAHPPRRRG